MKYAFVVLAATLTAGAVQAADLLEIYRDATLSDTKFASARMQLEAGREKYPQARAGMLPTLTLSGSSTYNNVDATLPAERKYAYNSNTAVIHST